MIAEGRAREHAADSRHVPAGFGDGGDHTDSDDINRVSLSLTKLQMSFS